MIAAQHQAEQRGNYEPLGALLYLHTDHGIVEFCEFDHRSGQALGPAVGETTEGPKALLMLGEWMGFPPVRRNSKNRCPECARDCDLCNGTGKQPCSGYKCGGNGWVPGNWIDCPGKGCKEETGKYNPECEVCKGTEMQGLVREKGECPACHGTKLMTCVQCRGTLKFSTGQAGGSTDWRSRKCEACGGTGFQGMLVVQDVNKFVNARLYVPGNRTPKHSRKPNSRSRQVRDELLVIGPIHEIGISDCHTGRTRVLDVFPDNEGDRMVLLVPAGQRQRQKAYLIAGRVGERVAERTVETAHAG